MDKFIDINESKLYAQYPHLLEKMLYDNSSKKNIIWGTSLYSRRGFGYSENDEITANAIIRNNGRIIKPRISKSKAEQNKRSKEMAEVFTPSWVCNNQNNLIDEAWFGRPGVFNIEKNKTWETNIEKIIFDGKSWEDYVLANRLEITCGEAPYIVSRYDIVNGVYIEPKNRIGLLDRKLRVINENAAEEEWFTWVKKAYQHVYGYDYQGDNVLLARENLLMTFIDYFEERYNLFPEEYMLLELVEIITWNIWQMDGLKCVVPNSCTKILTEQFNLFGESIVSGHECPGCEKNLMHLHNGIKCKIMDWDTNKKIEFHKLIKGGM